MGYDLSDGDHAPATSCSAASRRTASRHGGFFADGIGTGRNKAKLDISLGGVLPLTAAFSQYVHKQIFRITATDRIEFRLILATPALADGVNMDAE
jgi:hypothetical protein